jgi:hypothetical protein
MHYLDIAIGQKGTRPLRLWPEIHNLEAIAIRALS